MIRTLARTIAARDIEDELVELRIKRDEVIAVYAVRDGRGRRRRVEVVCSQPIETAVHSFFTQNRIDAIVADTYPKALIR